MPLKDQFSLFQQRWISETVRLFEAAHGSLDDRDALHRARSLPVSTDAEQRIVVRASVLADEQEISDVVSAIRLRGCWLVALLSFLSLIAGFTAALAVMGDGNRLVNVVWALAGLLGLNLLSLLLWGAGLWFSRYAAGIRGGGGIVGRLWLWLSEKLTSGEKALYAMQALTGLMRRAGLLPWWFGTISHIVWLFLLSGMLAGLLMTLSVRSYGFIWETTILPSGVFVDFVAMLGWLPAKLGFSVPDAQAVEASSIAAVQTSKDNPLRFIWSSWMIGCVVVYGFLPRLLLSAACFAGLQIRQRRIRLDLNLPAYAMLAMRVMPPSEIIGVSDAAPDSLTQPYLNDGHVIGNANALIVGIELRQDLPWPPDLPVNIEDAGVVDSREQRQRVLARLAARPPVRLLVVCDARLSPDRGTFSLIASFSQHAGDCRVWLVSSENANMDSERFGHWREGLLKTGMPPYGVFNNEAAALRWLEHGDE